MLLLRRGDHTFADSYLTVVPRGTEFVVFSIDGSFAASVSIMGSDPKVRAGAVDVVRYHCTTATAAVRVHVGRLAPVSGSERLGLSVCCAPAGTGRTWAT